MSLLDKVLGRDGRTARAIEQYNLGLKAKYAGDWELSFTCNQRATELNPADEAGWWNLGIAATALHRWPEARKAWQSCGVQMLDGCTEALMSPTQGCVRLEPDGAAEVVWGTRIDPARTTVLNVPLPESGRRYKDVVLHDGAQAGTRSFQGIDYPVFDELAIWKLSPYSTFALSVTGATAEALNSLSRLGEEHDVYYEDWSTVRRLCRACSLGHPGAHDCVEQELDADSRRLGLAARSDATLQRLLTQWREVSHDLSFGNPVLEVAGAAQ